MSIAEESLRFSGLFEAEVLAELMLRYWKHPLADDKEFRNNLLENASEALRFAISGQPLIEGLPAEFTNLVAAIWYCEWNTVINIPEGEPLLDRRQAWLGRVKRSLPSCFCNPEDLN